MISIIKKKKVLNKLEELKKHFLAILKIFTNVFCSSKLISNSNSNERKNTQMLNKVNNTTLISRHSRKPSTEAQSNKSYLSFAAWKGEGTNV